MKRLKHSSGEPVYNQQQPISPISASPISNFNFKTVKQSIPTLPGKPRLFKLPEAQIFHPTRAQFADPFAYIAQIRHVAELHGIIKIVPPTGWKPEFAMDVDSFSFKTRKQKLNAMDGTTRSSFNYLDQLSKFHSQQGVPFTRIPLVEKRPLDLFKLKKVVEARGGFDAINNTKNWPLICREIGFAPKTYASASISVKHLFLKWILPYEIYIAKNNRSSMPTPSPTEPVHPQETFTVSPTATVDSIFSFRPKRNSIQPFITPQKRPLPKDYIPRPGEELCEECSGGDSTNMLLCDTCNRGHHLYCLDPPLSKIPTSDWFCSHCLASSGKDFGFEEGDEYTLESFQKVCDNFKSNWFSNKESREGDVEKEFWHLIESPYRNVEVEYGADLHSSHHGSAFPIVEKDPLNPYSKHPWNLNNIPILPRSLFCNIEADISGMMIPWLYVGMVFSTFCWHVEDHNTYSINYLHWGESKTWYGIPSKCADAFERVMHQKVPELFAANPDLLFHLTTMLSPETLVKEGVDVYAIDQRPGDFVVTFPRAYHAGFNHGFNFAEAVNFALPDWLPFGRDSALLYGEYRKMPVFSHVQLVFDTWRKNLSADNSESLENQLQWILAREEVGRDSVGKLGILERNVGRETEDCQCGICFEFLSASFVRCGGCKRLLCFRHVKGKRCLNCGGNNELLAVITLLRIQKMMETCREVSKLPRMWLQRYFKVMQDNLRPEFSDLQSLLDWGTRIPYTGPEIQTLLTFVQRCKGWIRAAEFVVSENIDTSIDDSDWTHYSPEKTLENVEHLRSSGHAMSFNCPELGAIDELYKESMRLNLYCQEVMRDFDMIPSFADVEVLNVTVGRLDHLIAELKGKRITAELILQIDLKKADFLWTHNAENSLVSSRPDDYRLLPDYACIINLIESARQCKIKSNNRWLVQIKKMKHYGDLWNVDAHGLSKCGSIVKRSDLLELLDAGTSVCCLNELWESIVQRRKESDRWSARFRKTFGIFIERSRQPMECIDDRGVGRSMRSVLEEFDFTVNVTGDLQRVSTPAIRVLMNDIGVIGVLMDESILLREWLRYLDDWTAKFKRLFAARGTSSRTSHQVLHDVLENVERCTLVWDQRDDGNDIFCICRGPAEKFMIECDICKEWYHGSCVRITPKDAESRTRFICPVCCAKKPAASKSTRRPTIPQLQALAKELASLKFLPDERMVVDAIIELVKRWAGRVDQLLSDYSTATIGSAFAISNEHVLKSFLRSFDGLFILTSEEYGTRLRELVERFYPITPPQFCFCRRDDSLPMISCSECLFHYHHECLGLDTAGARKLQQYRCPVCVGTSTIPQWHSKFVPIRLKGLKVK